MLDDEEVSFVNLKTDRGIQPYTQSRIIIPQIIDGKTVKRLRRMLFSGHEELTTVIIPDSIIRIGECAFSGCSNLISLVVSEDSNNMMLQSYRAGLTSIVFPSSLTTINDMTFKDCRSLKKIIIPPHLTRIGKAAFFECRGLEELVIPNTVTQIGEYAFWGCANLKHLVVGRKNYQAIKNDIPSGVSIYFLD